MSVEISNVQLPHEFYENHHNADEIWVHEITGDPYKAVYARIDGIIRKYPAEYYYPEW